MCCFLLYSGEKRSARLNDVRGTVWSTLGRYRPLSRTDISVSNISSIIGVTVIHIYLFFILLMLLN